MKYVRCYSALLLATCLLSGGHAIAQTGRVTFTQDQVDSLVNLDSMRTCTEDGEVCHVVPANMMGVIREDTMHMAPGSTSPKAWDDAEGFTRAMLACNGLDRQTYSISAFRRQLREGYTLPGYGPCATSASDRDEGGSDPTPSSTTASTSAASSLPPFLNFKDGREGAYPEGLEQAWADFMHLVEERDGFQNCPAVSELAELAALSLDAAHARFDSTSMRACMIEGDFYGAVAYATAAQWNVLHFVPRSNRGEEAYADLAARHMGWGDGVPIKKFFKRTVGTGPRIRLPVYTDTPGAADQMVGKPELLAQFQAALAEVAAAPEEPGVWEPVVASANALRATLDPDTDAELAGYLHSLVAEIDSAQRGEEFDGEALLAHLTGFTVTMAADLGEVKSIVAKLDERVTKNEAAVDENANDIAANDARLDVLEERMAALEGANGVAGALQALTAELERRNAADEELATAISKFANQLPASAD